MTDTRICTKTVAGQADDSYGHPVAVGHETSHLVGFSSPARIPADGSKNDECARPNPRGGLW